MKGITYKDYTQADLDDLRRYHVANVQPYVNAEENGLMIELERVIDNVTIGVIMIYDPEHEDDETEMMISDPYVKEIR